MNKKGRAIPLQILVILSLLSAISIVCGKYLALNISEFLRFSLENMPILFAAIAFGPISAMAVGVVADLIGCLLVGYAINPLVTLGAAVIGIAGGILWKLLPKRWSLLLRIALVTVVAHIHGSVIIKSIGLAAFYSTPLYLTMLYRLVNYVLVSVLDSAVLFILLSNKSLMAELNKMNSFIKGKDMTEGKVDFKAYANSFQAVTVPGLERIGALCEKLGNPQRKLKFIHVAGTNGKGSVCANIASILHEAGYKTGKYISPNLIKVNERISIDGADISDEELNALLAVIEPLAKEVEGELGIPPTQFEIWCAAAFKYFEEQGCDYVVLEVGLGGELDATNIIEKNEVAVITRLGIDHIQYLGETPEEIASAKAGIIKKESGTGAVISAEQDEGYMPVIERVCRERGCRLVVPKPISTSREDIYEIFDLDGMKGIRAGIGGLHQIENAALAIAVAKELKIDENTIRRGVALATNPARFELISKDPVVIYDGGHNENGIDALVKSLKVYYGDVEKTVIFACMHDKDIEYSLKALATDGTEFIFTTVKNNPRAESAEGLRARAAEYGISGVAFEDIGDAYMEAKGREKLTLICGSLYLYKDLHEYLKGV